MRESGALPSPRASACRCRADALGVLWCAPVRHSHGPSNRRWCGPSPRVGNGSLDVHRHRENESRFCRSRCHGNFAAVSLRDLRGDVEPGQPPMEPMNSVGVEMVPDAWACPRYDGLFLGGWYAHSSRLRAIEADWPRSRRNIFGKGK
jgi:hypothetical protein